MRKLAAHPYRSGRSSLGCATMNKTKTVQTVAVSEVICCRSGTCRRLMGWRCHHLKAYGDGTSSSVLRREAPAAGTFGMHIHCHR